MVSGIYNNKCLILYVFILSIRLQEYQTNPKTFIYIHCALIMHKYLCSRNLKRQELVI